MMKNDEFDEFWENHPDAKPCPFCGGDKLIVRQEPSADRIAIPGYIIECESCGAMGGIGRTGEIALVLWQMRNSKNKG
jgi:Lar family restriction alleviation protein